MCGWHQRTISYFPLKFYVKVAKALGIESLRSELYRQSGEHGWLTSKKQKLPLTLAEHHQWCESKK